MWLEQAQPSQHLGWRGYVKVVKLCLLNLMLDWGKYSFLALFFSFSLAIDLS